MKHSNHSHHSYLFIALFVVCVPALAALLAYSPVLSATAPTDLEIVKAAWQRARQSGVYHFSADIQQTITPRATLLNVGRTSKHEAMHLEGQVNLPDQQLHMTLWSEGGSVLDTSSGVEVKVEGDHAAARQGAQDWQEIDNFTGLFAPQGDWMAFLAAATDVKRVEASGTSPHAARYSFRIDGRSYAAYLRDQLEQQLAEQGELPPGVELNLSTAYADMSGQGELWIGANGLPLRQILHLQFPPRPDEQANQADVTADFSGFISAEDEGRLTPSLLSPSVLNRGPLVAASLAFVFMLVARRRSRKWHAGVVVTLIVSMMFSPILQNARAAEVADRLLAKAQAEKQRDQDTEMQQTLSQAVAEPEQNPNVSPLDAARAAQEVGASPASGPFTLAAASNGTSSSTEDCDSGDTGDNDGDGLTNYEECILSTDPGNKDTDGDGLDDDQEVNGFSYKDKNWYTSPHDLDTNKDGLGDAQEWDANDNGQPDDTDGDGTPDLFDLDNDDDGVPDSLDLSPYYKNDTVYTSDSPFELVVDSLTQDKPTFIDFQVRPVITDHLWYAFNVLQWPTGDRQAQMQDVDGRTFYDVDDGRSRSPDDNGNVKVIPMLEIRMPSPPFNLPSESERKHYGITVQDLDEAGNSKAAYIPLQLVTQQRGGQHVAFSGRMLYRPGDQWGKAQQVRLVWAVQALVDVCDQYANGSCVHYETYNDERVLHTYNDDWQLTGLRVREEHGTSYAIVYEDPAADQDLNDDSALIRLSYGLERTFLAGRDCEKWDDKGDDDPSNDECVQSDGKRDITIDEIARRFNHATNSGVTVTDTWHISNTLSVITHTYATMDEAVATLVTTDTQAVLDDHFTAYWSAGQPISPTLLFAREERSRSLNLDDHLAYTGTITWSSDHRQVTLNVEPGAVKAQTVAGVNWAPYQYKDGQWKAYPIDDYWKLLKGRYQPAFSDAYTDEAQPGELADVRGGGVVMGQIYYLTLYAGVNVVVQVGQDPLKTRYQLDDKPIGAKIAKGASAAVLWLVNDILILENAFFSRTDVLKVFYRYMSGQKFFSAQGSTLKWLAGLPGSYKNMVTRLTSRAWLRAGIISLSAILALGVIYALLVVEKYYMADAGWAKGLVGSVAGVLLAYIFIYTPIVQVENLIRATMALSPNLTRAAAIKQVLTKSSEYMGAMRQIAIAGLVISLGLTWGVFIWAMASGKVKRGSLEMDALIAQTLAAHILTVLMFFLSLTVIGALIESVIMMVDLLLMILGVKWTVTYTLTFALTHYLFGFEMTVRDDDPDMIKMGDLDTHLVNPALGMSAGMQLEFKTTITSTVTNKDPKDPRAFAYLPTKYNEDDIRKNSLEYSLTSQATSLSTSLKDGNGRNPWDVNVDHRYAAHDMYNAVKYDNLTKVSTLDQPGINRTAPLALNIGFAMYALECWTIPPWIPMCLDKAVSDSTSADLGANVVVDVFPRTLDEFMRVKNWASSIAIKDADGDGLMSRAYGGVDPDDGRWDGDGDGLSDAWEMQMGTLRADEGGASFDVRRADTDNDGLSDYDEARLGTNPANADSDGDGLADVEEVAGWDFHYAGGKVTRIYSDPLDPDADHDGMTDQFERTLHVSCANEPAEKQAQCYRDNPYSPNVWNSNPIGVYTEVGDPDGIVRAGGSFVFTTTVQNNLKSADSLWVRGNTNLTLDSLTGYPLTMQYDIAKDKAQSLYSTLGVPANAGNKVVTLTTDAHSQLHAPSEWAWEKLMVNSRTLNETPLSIAVVPVKSWATAYAAAIQQGDRVMVYPATADEITGDGVWAFGGPNDSSQSDAVIACNGAGKCLVVWAFKHGSNQYTRWRLFQPTAQPVGNGITLTMPAGQEAWLASVASDGANFLVTWLQEDSTNSYVRVANVNANGTQNGAILTLDSGDVGRASLAWTGDRYQAVWERANDIYTAYISGQSVTSPQAVSATAANEFDPVLSYDALSDQTLVAYISRSGSVYSLRGRILAGTTTSDEIVLANPPQVPSWQVAVDDDPVNGGWVVAWSPNGARAVYYQAVGMDGGLRGRQQSVEPGGQTYQLNLAATAPRLSALFHFDEAAGITTFADSSGFDHAGGCRGTCPDAGQPGKQGQAVKFKGVYQPGDVEVKQANISNASYGVMFWFKADCNWSGGTGDTCGIYSVGDYWADNYYNHDRDIYLSNGNVCARLGQGDPNSTNSEVICSSGLNVADGKWHHVAHTFGASVGGQHLYVDGELRASGKRASSDLGVELRLRIGRAENVTRECDSRGYCGQVPYFQGWIDELALYPRALSAREVKDGYRAALVVYPFDEVSGNTIFKNAANSSFAAGQCSGAQCPQAGASGMANNAVQFDGGDVVNAANVPLANSSFTIAFWARRDQVSQNAYVIGQGDGSANRDLFIGWWSNNQAICAFDTSGNHLVTTRVFTDTGVWHHWACTYNTANRERALYYDGNLVAANTASANYQGTGALLIGKARWGNNLRGRVDEVAIWPEAFSAADVKTLYQKVKAQDDAVTEVLLPRLIQSSKNLYLNRSALHETTTPLGNSDQQVKDSVRIDANLPASHITSLSNNQHLNATGILVIGGDASDNTYVTQVDVSIDGGPWHQADGVESWAYDWDTSALAEGSHTLRSRATDAGGNVENSSTITVVIDRASPALFVNNVPRRASNDDGRWSVPLEGNWQDQFANAVSVDVLLQGQAGVAGYGWQSASTRPSSTRWQISYVLPTFDSDGNAVPNPTGIYTLSLRATDDAGNSLPEAVYSVLQLDNTSPIVDIRSTGPSTSVITATDVVLTGVITDPGAVASGVSSDAQPFFIPKDMGQQPPGYATLLNYGPGVVTTTWTYPVPAGMEDWYEIGLGTRDVVGNLSTDQYNTFLWSGMIDNQSPRVDTTFRTGGEWPFLYNDVACKVTDMNLDEDTFVGCPCPSNTWQRTYYHEVASWYASVTTDTQRLYQITAMCRINGPVLAIAHHVCDEYDHCTSTTVRPNATNTQALSPDALQAALQTATVADSMILTPTNGVVFSATAPIDVQGVAGATGSLRDLTVTANGAPFYVADWSAPPDPGAVTETTWSTLFTPVGEGHYILESTAGDWPGNTQTTTYPITVTIDLLPPAPPSFDAPAGTTGVITTAQRAYQGTAIFTGVATDTIGVARVQVNPDDRGWSDAALNFSSPEAGWGWRFLWSAGSSDPDGVTYNVAVRVTDLAGHTTQTTQPIIFDMQPPAPVTMTLAYLDAFATQHPVAPRQTVTDGSALIIAWTPGSDGSGIAGYWVGWNTSPTSTTGTTFVPGGTIYSYSQAIGEAQAVYAHLVTVDLYGNQREQTSGPIYVDSPLTPDYILLPTASEGVAAAGGYHGWMESGCTELGADRRVADHASTAASLSEAQKFYATWDANALRLAWVGANWDAEGDLFIYLDHKPGGATQLYDPYAQALPGTSIYLPGNLPASPAGTPPAFETVRQSMLNTPLLGFKMEADSLVWVQDASTAVLMSWNGSTWVTGTLLTNAHYQPAGDHTDLYLPFSLLGIDNPATTSLRLLAAASQEDALRLWAVMPDQNPVNGAQAVNSLAAVATTQIFPLTHAYYWPSLGSGLCPYTQAWLQPLAQTGFMDSDLRADITADPLGTTYALMDDDLFWQWQTLFQGSGPKSQQFDFLDHNHRPLGDGQVITYALHIANRGTSTATGVKALISAYYALSLAAGTRDDAGYREYQLVDVGDIAPGTTVTRTFTGVVKVNDNWRYTQCLSHLQAEACQPLLNWALLDGMVFDSRNPLAPAIGIPAQAPFEWLWSDHAVDTEPPQFVGINSPQFSVGPGANVIRGYASDPSGVPLVQVQVRDSLGVVTTLTCPDATPDDGQWTCDWPIGMSVGDGDEFLIRAQATDGLGHASAWTSPWRNLIVDTRPPTVTLDTEARAAVEGQIVGPAGVLLAGSLADNHSTGQVQVCRDTSTGTVCDWASTLMTTLAPTNTASIYDDVPATPVDIAAATYCGGGEITRFFNVTDDFIAGNVELGFNAIHPNRAEIVAELVSPAGTRVRVIDPSRTMYGFANDDVWLSDAAAGSLHVSSDDDPTEPYYDRLARPDTPLSAFNGEAAVGVWQLRICDANPLLNDGMYARSRLSLTPQGAALSTAGTWAYALPTLAGADGLTQTLSIYGMDDVGNRTTGAISLTYQLDVVPPALTVTTIITRRQQLFPLMVLAGQVSDGSGLNEVYVRVDPPEGASYRDAASRSGAYWSYTLRPATPGIYTLWLAAYDAVGNVTTMGPYVVQASAHWLYLPVVMNKSSGETGANLLYLPLLMR